MGLRLQSVVMADASWRRSIIGIGQLEEFGLQSVSVIIRSGAFSPIVGLIISLRNIHHAFNSIVYYRDLK